MHLEGALVRIERFEERDLSERYLGWLNDPETMRFSNQRFRDHDLASCRHYFDTFADSENDFLSVRRRGGGDAIGTMTVYHNQHHGTADVGIMIGDRSCWGRGFGQDAWDTVLSWLLGPRGTRKVTAGTVASNRGMVRLMERSGMTLEGVRRGQELIDGTPEDIVLYGKFAR